MSDDPKKGTEHLARMNEQRDALEGLVVRPARPDDADALHALARTIAEEADGFSANGPEEVRSAAAMRATIEQVNRVDLFFFEVVEDAGRIVGEVNVRQASSKRGMRHVALLGVTLAASHRRRGIGAALCRRAIAWARATGVLRRIELEVFADNAPAVALYERLGFALEGRRRRAFVRDGRYVDDLVMAILLE